MDYLEKCREMPLKCLQKAILALDLHGKAFLAGAQCNACTFSFSSNKQSEPSPVHCQFCICPKEDDPTPGFEVVWQIHAHSTSVANSTH